MLENIFNRDPRRWSKQECSLISKQIRLSYQQVYKWSWDQEKKYQASLNSPDGERLYSTDEFGGYNTQQFAKPASPASKSQEVATPTFPIVDASTKEVGGEVYDSLCKLLNIDISEKLREITQSAEPERQEIQKSADVAEHDFDLLCTDETLTEDVSDEDLICHEKLAN